VAEYTYIRMEQVRNTGKTLIWEVLTKDGGKDPGGGELLGEVKWFGRWRGYAFFPLRDTIYEHRCLRDIADFVETQTKAHRAKKRKKS